MSRSKADALRPVPQQVERQLDRQVAEACAPDPAREEATGALEKLSETLTLAAQAAHAAAWLRRRMRETMLVEKLAELGVHVPVDSGNVPRRYGKDDSRTRNLE